MKNAEILVVGGRVMYPQNHRQHSHSIEHDYLLNFNRDYASSLFRFRVIVRTFTPTTTEYSPKNNHAIWNGDNQVSCLTAIAAGAE